MKLKFNKKYMILFFILALFVINNQTLAADTTRIEIIPEKPNPESDIEIIAYTEFPDIEQIYLEIQECDINSGICYERKNISMNKIDENSYKTSYTLIESKATYIQYNLKVKSNNGWETLIDKEITNLSISQNNDNGKNNNGNQNTPGFEIIGLFIGILSIILFNRYRKR